MSYVRVVGVICLFAAAAGGQVLTEDRKLTAADADGNEEFGRSVAIAGGVALVGAPFESGPISDAGAAYLFDVATGQQVAKLSADDAEAFDQFGESVSIGSNAAVVGAPSADATGVAYVFDAASGQQLFRLTSSDGGTGDRFGSSVAISGGLIVIGAPGHNTGAGAAYVFDLLSGAQLFKLIASDGAMFESFGTSVSIDGSVAVVGAPNDDDNGFGSGSAYVFELNAGQQLYKFTADDGDSGDGFGGRVSVSSGAALIGAANDEVAGPISGSAYVFDIATGQQLFKLTASDASAGDEFGGSLGLSGSVAVIGAAGDTEGGFDSGSAYLFDVTSGQQIAKLAASDAALDDRFGDASAISGSSLIVGATGDADGGPFSGSVYAFTVPAAQPCPADIADDFGFAGGDGQVGFGDFLLALTLLGPCGGGVPGCDFDIADDFGFAGADGQVGFGDFLYALALLGPCP